uniref:ATP synthase subunit a n=1 Tax=Metacrangonyx sp. n. DJ2019 TaxID=2606684 RepID=A0A5C0PYT7_9CRUS|nr:ATP synthase F0 subunit 6 [Metacrangonyx sp. n. DJ2019]
MTMNLFSIFDPSTLYFVNNWVSGVLWMIFIPLMFWVVGGRLSVVYMYVMSYMLKEFKPLLLKSSFSLLVILSVFVFILVNNVLGLFPYVFCASSHMSFTLSLGAGIWVSLMIYSWGNNLSNQLIHLIPQGTSALLMPFMVLVETISNIIRPITLSIRLCANMIAGHLLITLLSMALMTSTFITISLVATGMTALMVLEIAVAFIQAYVFGMLITLYTSEMSS